MDSTSQLPKDTNMRSSTQLKFIGLNVVRTRPVHPSITQMPSDLAHMAIGPPGQMVRLPDHSSGEALWISADAYRYYQTMLSDQTWALPLHASAPSVQSIMESSSEPNFGNIFFSSTPSLNQPFGSGSGATTATTNQDIQTATSQSTDSAQMSNSRTPEDARSSRRRQQSVTTQARENTLQQAMQQTQSGAFVGPYGNIFTGPPPNAQNGTTYRELEEESFNGTEVSTSGGDPGEQRLFSHTGSGGLSAQEYLNGPPRRFPSTTSIANFKTGSQPREEESDFTPAPRRGGRTSRFGGGPRALSSRSSRVSNTGGRRRVCALTGLSQRQVFHVERMKALANGTALQTAAAPQAVLDRLAPIVPNGPRPDHQKLANELRRNFGGDGGLLSNRGTFMSDRAARAEAKRLNAIGWKNGEDGEDSEDPDEPEEPED